MMIRLDELLGTDGKARWRIIFVSAAAIAIWGILSELHGDSVHEAQVNATICGALVFVLQVFAYCALGAKPEVRLEWIATVPRRLVMTAAAAIVLAVIPGPAVEAAILDRRLRLLTRDGRLSPQQAKEVSSVLEIATAGPITLSERTRVQVYQAIKTSGLQNPNSLPIVNSANNLVRYTREATFPPILDARTPSGSAEARTAYSKGAAYARSLFLGPPTIPPAQGNRQDALSAVSELTRAIQLSTAQDRDLLVGALSIRARMYVDLLQPDDALRDAGALESLGDTDLSNVLSIEAAALFMRGGRDDLDQAVRLFTLLSELDPPTWASSDPRPLRRIDAIGNRGRAYYRLGAYEESIEDSKRALDLLFERQGAGLSPAGVLWYLRLAYLSIIASDLRLGKLDEARREAYSWSEKSGRNPDALRVIAELESKDFDEQRWLREYKTVPLR